MTPAAIDTPTFIPNKQSQRPSAFQRRIRAEWHTHSCTAQHQRIHKANKHAERPRGSQAAPSDVRHHSMHSDSIRSTWSRSCSAHESATHRNKDPSSMYKSRIARPEQLCVVHERGNGELSLQTRKGGKHAPRGQQGILGAKPSYRPSTVVGRRDTCALS